MAGLKACTTSERCTAGLKACATSERPALRLPPHFLCCLNNQPQLPLLVVHCDGIAHEVAGEAALRAEAELIERQVLCRFVDAAFEHILRLEHRRLGRDEA